MIQRVYEQALKAKTVGTVFVATDDKRILSVVESFGGNVVMTSSCQPTGTDRCNEAYQQINAQSGNVFDVVMNIQGDEPFIDPSQIDLLSDCFLDPEVEIATLIYPLSDNATIANPSAVKVVVDYMGKALYFSRSAVPFLRNFEFGEWNKHHQFYKHVGIYAWRSDVLKAICSLPPSSLEQAESLEQLRWLENGFKIQTRVAQFESIAIDTPEDLLKLTNID